MSNEIKIIGNMGGMPSRYDPDLARKLIEEQKLEEERKRLESKNPKPKEKKAAVKIPSVPNLAVSYIDIEFEATAFRENGSNDKKLFYFNDSLDRIKAAGYERHARPQEVFSLIIDGLEGKLTNTSLQNVYDDMYKDKGEFFSLAWERKGDLLIAYLDPKGLVWNDNKNGYDKNILLFAEKKEFDITGKCSQQSINLKEFDDEFIKWHYTRKFSELPDIMQKGDMRAQVWLCSDGSIWPVGREKYINRFNISVSHSKGASRGVRKKSP